MLTEDLPLLVRSIGKLVVVLHLGRFLANLDHVVQIRDFHRETLLLFFAVDKALVICNCVVFDIYFLTSVDVGTINRLSHTDLLVHVSLYVLVSVF